MVWRVEGVSMNPLVAAAWLGVIEKAMKMYRGWRDRRLIRKQMEELRKDEEKANEHIGIG